MLRMRLRSGLPRPVLTGAENTRADTAVADGLLHAEGDRLVLTDRGRLLADAVIRDVLAD
jgi:oxygen-independent coproporphyrinogen-3 oxidase